MLAAALDYVRRGFAVFPLKPNGKTPITKHGHKEASTDEAQIKAWWTENPRANIGLVVGEDSDILVFDIESLTGHSVDGVNNFKQLEAEHGPAFLNDPYEVTTASGGKHYYCIFPAELKGKRLKKNLADGVELKFKGYVVGPPSTIDGSAYEITHKAEGGNIAPSWVELCIAPEPVRVPRVEGNGSTFCERNNISMFDVCDVPPNARQVGGNFAFSHPKHDSTTGTNFQIKTDGSMWHCFHHETGGDPMIWVAVREGFIECEDAGPLDTDMFRRCREVLRREGRVLQEPTITEPSDDAPASGAVVSAARCVDECDEAAAYNSAVIEYEVDGGRLKWISEKYDKKGLPVYTHVPLTNFNAWITQAITYDDGAERTKYYEIEGLLDDDYERARLQKLKVRAYDFDKMAWVNEWDGRAIIRVGSYIREHARAAIQFLSIRKGYPIRYVYSHAGWREIGGAWNYLHSGGAINAKGLNAEIDVEFHDPRLKVFDLPEPPSGEALREDISTVISLLDDATELDLLPEWLIYFDIAKVFRAPLNEVLPIQTSDFLAGKTGVFKTAYHALFQAFFGVGFDAATLPANWSSTDNQLERILYIFKDAVCEIDDFKPHGNASQIIKAHSMADRVFRNHANKQGRGRLKANSDFAATYYSRAFPSSSGEDIPTGQSLRGRMLIREIQEGDIDLAWLTSAQAYAASGIYARVMSSFLMWLAPRLDALRDETLETFRDKREQYLKKLECSGAHVQTYGALADLYLGFNIFMRFALSTGAITRARADDLTETCEDALLTVGSYQGGFIRSEEPTTQFIDLIGAVLASGRGHLCDVASGYVPLAPLKPNALGWDYGRELTQTDEAGYATNVTQTWVHKGPCVGWIDNDTIYLEPSVAYAEAQKLARDKGTSIPFTETTLYKRMSEKGLIFGDDDGSHIRRVKKINGKAKRCIWIEAARVLGGDAEVNDE